MPEESNKQHPWVGLEIPLALPDNRLVKRNAVGTILPVGAQYVEGKDTSNEFRASVVRIEYDADDATITLSLEPHRGTPGHKVIEFLTMKKGWVLERP